MTDTAEDRVMQGRGNADSPFGLPEATLGLDDQRWLADRLGGRDSIAVRFHVATDTDTEGHGLARSTSSVHVRIASDELDTEGHTFTLHFPTMPDAEAFKRGVAAGAISATLLLGGVAGAFAVSANHPVTSPAAPAAAAPAAAPHAHPNVPVINVRWGGRSIPQ